VRKKNVTYCDIVGVVYGSAVFEVVDFIQNAYLFWSVAPEFKLCEITELVKKRMAELGVPDYNINRTSLKNELLSFIRGASKSGREVVLSFTGGLETPFVMFVLLIL